MSAPPVFDFASFLNVPPSDNTSNNKRQRGDVTDFNSNNNNNNNSSSSTQQNSAFVNPNLQSLRQNNDSNVENIIEGLGQLNIKQEDKVALAQMSMVHQQRSKALEEEKKVKSSQNKELKKHNEKILQILITCSERLNKPDIQLQPLSDVDTVFTIDWGAEIKPCKIDENYVFDFLKDHILIERRPLVTTEHIKHCVEQMFSEGERMARAKKGKAKPKLKILSKSEINPLNILPMSEALRTSNMQF